MNMIHLYILECSYSIEANNFFAKVFGSLLENNEAVCASIMVGICQMAKSGCLSSLDHLKIFPMHAKDDRYAKFFLFTEKELEILCDSQNQLSFGLIQSHYNGYAATSKSGLVKLYNPLSVISALQMGRISDFWVETGQHSPLSQCFGMLIQGFVTTLIFF
ncbi:hypothetical protein BJV77DRAFT_658918 [Russula vinacea]|nr:hypothetical protein BJV77DRAFT_658918 [Russula vinacea]